MNDKDRVQQFIIKATGKTIGRNSKDGLSMLFANSYAEYVKAVNQLQKGYEIYKQQEEIITKISDAIKDIDTIPTEVIKTIIETPPISKKDNE